MRAKVFKSLTKPVYWGGLPRELFIALFMFGLLCLMIFHSLKAIFPLFILYAFLVGIVKIDHRIFSILNEAFRLKSHYF